MRIGEGTESDHLLLEMRIQGLIVRGRDEDKGEAEVVRSDWSREGIEHYHKEIARWKHRESGREKLWQELRDKIDKSTRKRKCKGTLEKRKWFNAE